MTTFTEKQFNFGKYKAFFCFGEKQLKEGKEKYGITNEKLVSFDFGLIALKSNYKEMLEAYSLHNKKEKERKKEFYKNRKWEEITEEQYWDMLEVLPPEEFKKSKKGEIFRMSEYMSGNYTDHYKNIGDKYYRKEIDVKSYKNILDLV